MDAVGYYRGNDEFTVFGYLREGMILPNDIIQLIITFYSLQIKLLSFSEIHRSQQGCILSENNKCFERTHEPGGSDYSWVISDIEPVKTGIYCWRIQIDNPLRGYIIIGVGPRTFFTDKSNNPGVYGIAQIGSTTYWKPNKRCKHNDVTMSHFGEKYLEIDMLFNVEQKTLSFCVIGTNPSTKTAKIYDIKRKYSNNGWVPHFNVGYTANGAKLRIVQIPNDMFGENQSHFFEKLTFSDKEGV